MNMDPVDAMNALLGMEDDSSLNEYQRRVCLLNRFEAECLNGGWDQYFWNSSGDHADETEKYLREFGYKSICEAFRLVRDAMGGAIPRDRDERIDLLDKFRFEEDLSDRIHFLVSEEVNEVFSDLCRYIKDHETDFKQTRERRKPNKGGAG